MGFDDIEHVTITPIPATRHPLPPPATRWQQVRAWAVHLWPLAAFAVLAVLTWRATQ